jgi:sulfite exporter TauE/SafE
MFITGLAGGFGHCIGMCGPVVAAYSLGEPGKGVVRHLLYNIGRITAYTLLGGLVGITGSFLVLTSAIAHFQTAIQVLAGVAVALMGMANAGLLPFGKILNSWPTFTPFFQKIMGLFREQRSIGAYYPMGLLLGFLPCGLTYTALLAAARSAMDAGNHFTGMLQGAFMMFLFGLGTAPALVLVGKTVHLAGERSRIWFYRLASLVMTATGIYFIHTAFSK